jgi:hypothetical protein
MFRAFICSSSVVLVVTLHFVFRTVRENKVLVIGLCCSVSRSNLCRLRGRIYWNEVLRIVLTGVGGTVGVRCHPLQ